MKQRDMEVILGIIVFFALASLIVGVAWLSSRLNLRVGDYKLHIVFDDIGTIHAGDHVNTKGIQVGKVLKTGLYEGKPTAYVAIWDPPGGVPKDSRFWLKSESILGGYIVDIDLGEATEITPSESYVSGKMYPGFENLASNAKRLSDRLTDAKEGVLSDENMRRIGSTLASLDSVTASFNQVLSSARKPLQALLDSLGGATSEVSGAMGEARGMMGDTRPDVRQAVRNLSRATARLDSLTVNLNGASTSFKATSENLRDITQKVRNGEGTVGKLLYDEQLYGDLRKTLARVDSIMADLQRDPKRYLKISVF